MNIENENDHLIIITRYLSGEATPEQAMELHEWLKEPENKVEYDRIVSLWNQLPGSVGLNDMNVLQEWKELENAVEAKQKKRKIKSVYRYMAAASIILMITVGFFLFKGQRKAENNFQEETIVSNIDAKNDILNQKLPDSSILTLNRNSKISYASDFNTASRELKLSGEAFFDIAHNESKPFIISVDDLKIRVVGTSFNVKEHQDRQQVVVQVQTGIVKMYTKNKELFVKKGQSGIFEITTGELILRNDININSISYATKTFYFSDISFDDAVVYLEDAFSVDVQYDKSIFKECSITAEFANKPITYILDVISATLNTTYTQKGNTFYLSGQGCQ